MAMTTRNSSRKKGNVVQKCFSSGRFLRRLFLNLPTFRYSPDVPRGPFILQRDPYGPSVEGHVMGGEGREREGGGEEGETQREKREPGSSSRADAWLGKVRGVGERRRGRARGAVDLDVEGWRKRGRRRGVAASMVMSGGGGGRGQGSRGRTGGAAQNCVAAGSGSASRLSLAIALVRRVKVGINGRKTLLSTGWLVGPGGERAQRAEAWHGGATADRTVGVSSWVPKEEKLSWRTGTPPRASPPSPSLLSLSLLLFLSFPFSFIRCTSCRRRNREFFRRTSEEDGGRYERVRSSLWKVPRLVHLSFRWRKRGSEVYSWYDNLHILRLRRNYTDQSKVDVNVTHFEIHKFDITQKRAHF